MDDERLWSLQAGRALMNPTTAGHVLEAGRLAEISSTDLVLDLGSGNGSVLCMLADAFGCRGLGIDSRPEAVDTARALARERGLDDRVAFRCDDAARPSTPVPAPSVALCLGAASAFGGIDGALVGLRAVLGDGGRAVLGERYWRVERVPPEFARSVPDCVTEYELLAIARGYGFSLTGIVRSGEAEFDAYESAIWAGCRAALAREPYDDEVREYLDRIQEEYLGYGREYVGWAMYVLVPPP
jgi:SAM-dependent methyltransferase